MCIYIQTYPRIRVFEKPAYRRIAVSVSVSVSPYPGILGSNALRCSSAVCGQMAHVDVNRRAALMRDTNSTKFDTRERMRRQEVFMYMDRLMLPQHLH